MAQPRRIGKRATAALAAGALAGTFKGYRVPPADAYPRLDGLCSVGTQNLRWAFTSGSGSWTTADKDVVEIAVDDWTAHRDVSGGIMADQALVSSGSLPIPIPVRRMADQNANETVCVSGVPTRIDIGRTGIGLADTARHEFGHAHGLSHSGRNDALGVTSHPALTTCLQDNTSREITTDDLAQLSHEHDGARLTHNAGFENPGQMLGTFTRSTAAPYQGSYSAGVAEDDYVETRPTRITSAPTSIRMRARWKTQGSASLKFTFRTVDYPSGSNCTNQYNPNSIDWSNPNTPGNWVIHESRSLGSSGGFSYTQAYVPPPPGSAPGFSSYDAIDVKVTLLATDNTVIVDNMDAR